MDENYDNFIGFAPNIETVLSRTPQFMFLRSSTNADKNPAPCKFHFSLYSKIPILRPLLDSPKGGLNKGILLYLVNRVLDFRTGIYLSALVYICAVSGKSFEHKTN